MADLCLTFSATTTAFGDSKVRNVARKHQSIFGSRISVTKFCSGLREQALLYAS